jgi:hypothetical protein
VTIAMVSPITHGAKITNGIEPIKERITPHRAAELLTLNQKNRHIRKSVVERYVQDMAAGRWEFNGAPIIISDTNVLIDGQHRLTAIVESGVALPFVVIYDAPDSLRYTVDQGAARKPGDILAFAGIENSTAVASIARVLMSREAGLTTISGYRPSNAAIKDWVVEHPDIIEASDVYGQSRRQVPANPSIIAAAYYLCSRISPEHAHDFFVRRLINTEGLSATDPVRVLRKRLTEMPGRDSAQVKSEQLRYIILAWNIDREGRRIQRITAPKGGWTRHNFPEPK